MELPREYEVLIARKRIPGLLTAIAAAENQALRKDSAEARQRVTQLRQEVRKLLALIEDAPVRAAVRPTDEAVVSPAPAAARAERQSTSSLTPAAPRSAPAAAAPEPIANESPRLRSSRPRTLAPSTKPERAVMSEVALPPPGDGAPASPG